MDPDYMKALRGITPPDELRTRTPQPYIQDGQPHEKSFRNETEVPVRANILTNTNEVIPGGIEIYTGKSKGLLIRDGQRVRITSAQTGSAMCVFETVHATNTITTALLCPPNTIGPVPVPNQDLLIPPDSARVMVGCARLGGASDEKYHLIREQFWARLPDSYVLAPGETREVSLTTTSGMQDTSSEQDTVAANLDVNASGGWGPVSASVSMSLSKTSASFHQVTLTSETSTYVSDRLSNDTNRKQMYLRWQLTDVITITTHGGKVMSSIISGQSPAIVAGPYDPETGVVIDPQSL